MEIYYIRPVPSRDWRIDCVVIIILCTFVFMCTVLWIFCWYYRGQLFNYVLSTVSHTGSYFFILQEEIFLIASWKILIKKWKFFTAQHILWKENGGYFLTHLWSQRKNSNVYCMYNVCHCIYIFQYSAYKYIVDKFTHRPIKNVNLKMRHLMSNFKLQR